MIRLLKITTLLALLLNTGDTSIAIAAKVTAESLKITSDEGLADLLAQTEHQIKICQATHYVAKYQWVARDSGAFKGLSEDEITQVFRTTIGLQENEEEEALRCIATKRKEFLLIKGEILRRLSGVVADGEADRRKRIKKMKEAALNLQGFIQLHNQIMKKLGEIKVEPGSKPRSPLNDDEQKAVDDVIKALMKLQETLNRDGGRRVEGGGAGGDGNR